MIREIILAATIALALPASSSASEIIIGRWCDVWFAGMSNTMTIYISASGDAIMTNEFSEGSSLEQPLDELGGDVYEAIGNEWGEKYRIVPSSGELQLLDDDGLIRTARRLENTPRTGECP